MEKLLKKGILMTALAGALWQTDALACTRALYTGEDNLVITGRTLDWSEDIQEDIWVFPRGMTRDGLEGENSPQWVSKYGSVVTAVYNLASADGMNEKGLVMNMLYLAESDYGKPSKRNPPVSVSVWGQYVLDNFATVSEAVEAMQAKPFFIVAPMLPNGSAAQIHLSISDSTGDSAIFEYIDGALVIHHGKQYNVMTNSPIYSKQLAINEYWQSVGGVQFLPGTARAADRFVRASFYINNIPKKADEQYMSTVPQHSYENQATAAVLSVMRSVSVPLGIKVSKAPNIASTTWRTVSDQKRLIYYFDSSTRPNTFWLDLKMLNFDAKAPVLKLALAGGEVYAGEASQALKPHAPFKFLA